MHAAVLLPLAAGSLSCSGGRGGAPT